MWGISEAFKIAEQKAQDIRQPWVISIFCDSKTVINHLKECDSAAGQALKMQIYQKAKKLIQQGHEISVRWVPGHSGIEGNERADKAAKEAAIGERVRTAKWSSLTHIKRQIIEEKKLQISMWHEQKKKERESSRRGYYVPSLQAKIHPLLGRTRKFYASRFYQLKVGHGAIGTFLERIGATESAKCWWCGDAEQSVIHLYTKCRKWRTERRVLTRDLHRAGIQWQRRPEKKWLAELLANQHAVGPLLKFLKDTEVGCREGEAEKAAERGKGRDQDGEDQLGDP